MHQPPPPPRVGGERRTRKRRGAGPGRGPAGRTLHAQGVLLAQLQGGTKDKGQGSANT